MPDCLSIWFAASKVVVLSLVTLEPAPPLYVTPAFSDVPLPLLLAYQEIVAEFVTDTLSFRVSLNLAYPPGLSGPGTMNGPPGADVV